MYAKGNSCSPENNKILQLELLLKMLTVQAQLHPPLQPQQPLGAALAMGVVIAGNFLVNDVEQHLKLLWVLRLARPQPLQEEQTQPSLVCCPSDHALPSGPCSCK